jgi:hypothetical protein
VDDLDFQVLIEADMLVNLEEEKLAGKELLQFIQSFLKPLKVGNWLKKSIYPRFCEGIFRA